MNSARYVISPEKETLRGRPTKRNAMPVPLQVLPSAPDTVPWPLTSVISVAGLVIIALLLTHQLIEATSKEDAETNRANAAAVQADALGRRLSQLTAELARLSDDRRQLLRRISESMQQEASARAQWQKAAQASKEATAQTELVASQWSDYSSNLERTLHSTHSRALGLEGELQAARSAAATNADKWNRELKNLTSEKADLEKEAAGYRQLADDLKADTQALRQEVSSLQSRNGSLESENQSLRGQNRQLLSELTYLRVTISGLQSEISCLRQKLTQPK